MEKQKASSSFFGGGSNDQYYDWWYFHSILTPTVYQNQSSTYIPDFSVEVKKYPNFLTLTLDLVGWSSECF